MTVEAARNDDADWVSVSNLARERGVSQPAISKRIKALSEAGQLTTRQSGRRVLIHRPTFEALAAAAHDPAQDLRNRHQRGASASDDSPRELVEQSELLKPAASVETAKKPPKPSAYDDASTREKNAKAQLAEMQLAQKRSELIPVRDIEVAAIEAGTKIAQAVSSLKAKAGRFYAAGATGGEEALHVELVQSVNETLKEIGDSMAQLATLGAEESD